MKSAPAENDGENPRERGAISGSREPTLPSTKGRTSKAEPFLSRTRLTNLPYFDTSPDSDRGMCDHSSISLRPEVYLRTWRPNACSGFSSKRRIRSGISNSAVHPSAVFCARAIQFSSQSREKLVSSKRVPSTITPEGFTVNSKAVVPSPRVAKDTLTLSVSTSRSRRVRGATTLDVFCVQWTPT